MTNPERPRKKPRATTLRPERRPKQRQPRESQRAPEQAETSIQLSASMETKLRHAEAFLSHLPNLETQVEQELPLETLDRLNHIQIVLSAIYLAKIYFTKVEPTDPNYVQNQIALDRILAENIVKKLQAKREPQEPNKNQDAYNQLVRQTTLRRLNFIQRCADLAEQFQLNEESVFDLMEMVKKQQQEVLEDIPTEIPDVLKTFNENQRAALIDNMSAAELTKGCSLGCPFCGFSALKQVRASMPLEQAYWLALNGTGDKFYYYASDPLDYENYVDIVTVHEARYKCTPCTSTAYPTHGAQQLTALGDRVSRVSISQMNIRRLIRDGFYRQLDNGDILPVPEDLVDATFKDTLSTFPHFAFWIKNDQKKKIAAGLEPKISHEIRHRFLGMHIDMSTNLLTGTPKRTGRARLADQGDSPDLAPTIACQDGVLINCDGVHNSVVLFSSSEYPNGLLNIQLSPESLHDGHSRLLGLQPLIASESPVRIGRVLPHGVVHSANAYDSPAVFSMERVAQEMRAFADKAENDEDAAQREESFFLRTITLTAWDASDQTHDWVCQYDLRDGTLNELRPRE